MEQSNNDQLTNIKKKCMIIFFPEDYCSDITLKMYYFLIDEDVLLENNITYSSTVNRFAITLKQRKFLNECLEGEHGAEIIANFHPDMMDSMFMTVNNYITKVIPIAFLKLER